MCYFLTACLPMLYAGRMQLERFASRGDRGGAKQKDQGPLLAINQNLH